eukprot:CAMPEP_0182932160 /NCGR_PEP_ID=MMETSP0105_2-20130417/30544_1 /TAXON_ID=81532 ORGANISM="Acanthoeca-like sp., Strain 10tr" /NCGR_SAMPLE_ID=MMETSP0105_2 /ASSEMBLY_ACC=CAM_ASM_000205 /LENGTH=120 /DNA_ID=CAMNT_0025070711 /DNA_START=104 /DNA_END=463 /DNA_ORIENTATION=-
MADTEQSEHGEPLKRQHVHAACVGRSRHDDGYIDDLIFGDRWVHSRGQVLSQYKPTRAKFPVKILNNWKPVMGAVVKDVPHVRDSCRQSERFDVACHDVPHVCPLGGTAGNVFEQVHRLR